ASVIALINSAITTHKVMIVVVRIDPNVVIVDVLGSFTKSSQRTAAIIGNHQKHIHHIDAIDIFGISNNARVVHCGYVVFIAAFPTPAAVAGAEDATLSIGGFN